MRIWVNWSVGRFICQADICPFSCWFLLGPTLSHQLDLLLYIHFTPTFKPTYFFLPSPPRFAVSLGNGLSFEAGQPWDQRYTAAMEDRWVHITVPYLLDKGRESEKGPDTERGGKSDCNLGFARCDLQLARSHIYIEIHKPWTGMSNHRWDTQSSDRRPNPGTSKRT